MNVNAAGSAHQMQMRKMDGTGNGNGGGNGMRDIMQSLSTEDRTTLQEELSALSQAEKASMVEQMKQVDKTNMSDDDYLQALLDILTPSEVAETDAFSVYA